MKNKTTLPIPGLLTAALLSLASSADAVSIIVNNPSFESQTVGDGEAFTTAYVNDTDALISTIGGDSTITDWTESDSDPEDDRLSFVLNPGVGSHQATDGNNMAFIQNTTISQDLSGFILSDGDTISVTFDVSNTTRGNGASLWVNFAGIGRQSPDTIIIDTAPVERTVTFNVGAGQDGATSGILSFRSTTGAHQYRIDNVRVDHTPIPEPSSAALLGLGGLALILRRRK